MLTRLLLFCLLACSIHAQPWQETKRKPLAAVSSSSLVLKQAWTGSDTKGGQSGYTALYSFGFQFTPSSTFTGRQLQVSLNKSAATTTSVSFTGAVYSTSSNLPGTRLTAATNLVTMNSIGTTAATFSFNLASDYTFTNGVTYYFCLDADSVSATTAAYLRYQYTGGALRTARSTTALSSPTWANVDTAATAILSIYGY